MGGGGHSSRTREKPEPCSSGPDISNPIDLSFTSLNRRDRRRPTAASWPPVTRSQVAALFRAVRAGTPRALLGARGFSSRGNSGDNMTDDRSRQAAINEVVGSIHKSYGEGAIMRLGETSAECVEVIPTGSLA